MMFNMTELSSDSVMSQASDILKDSEKVNDPAYQDVIEHIFSMVETRDDIDMFGILYKHLISGPINNQAGLYLYKQFDNLDFLHGNNHVDLLHEMILVGNTDAVFRLIECGVIERRTENGKLNTYKQ